MKSARTTYLLLAILVIAFVAFNLASSYWLKGYRIDLTDNKLYTLSDGSRKILRELQSPLELKLYFSQAASKDLPSLRSYARRVIELLQEYEALAGDKLRIQVLDPEPFSEAEDAATLAGLQAIPAGNQAENLYFGLVGRNEEGKEEVIPFFQLNKEQFLEYELTKLIYNLDRQKLPVIGILSSLRINGGFDMLRQQRQPAWVIVQHLEDLFEVRWLPDNPDQIDSDIDVLMLVHPKHLPATTELAIDQYVLNGGKALVFVDPFAETDQPGAPMLSANHSFSSNLETLFKAWGLQLQDNQVVADFAQALVVAVPGTNTPVRHLALLGLRPAAFNTDDVVLGGLDAINVSSAGALVPLEGATTTFDSLLLSSPESSLVDAGKLHNMRNPEVLFDGFEAKGDVLTMAARISGPAKTAFPDGVEVSVPAGDEGTQAATEKRMPAKLAKDNINVFVVADTDILSDRLWVQIEEFFGQQIASPWADNGGFLVNSLEHLSGDADLISVRNRGRFTRPFEVVEDLRRQAEERLRDSEQLLQSRLRETEDKLAELEQAQQSEEAALLTAEQQQALVQFQQEKARIRKELRDVQLELNRDIDALGRNLKLVNILLVPVLLTLFALLIKLLRRSSRTARV